MFGIISRLTVASEKNTERKKKYRDILGGEETLLLQSPLSTFIFFPFRFLSHTHMDDT